LKRCARLTDQASLRKFICEKTPDEDTGGKSHPFFVDEALIMP
jgi:hypothetical protein